MKKIISAVSSLLIFASCGTGLQIQPKKKSCVELTGTSWSPSVSGASSSNHSGVTTVSKTTQTVTAKMAGAGDLPTSVNLTTITFVVGDLGVSGSLTLTGRAENPDNPDFPPYVILTSLVDPNSKDWVNLKAACASGGLYTCSGSSCSQNASCGPDTAGVTAYASRNHWWQGQVPVFGATSMNTFPTCNWGTGTPACAFNSSYFVSSKLPAGTYTAKFFVVDTTKTTSSTSTQMKIDITQKTDNVALGATHSAALDFNVILVGNSVINDSRTNRGKLNLNILMEQVRLQYVQANTNIKMGSINAYEWTCAQNGDSFASPSLYELGNLFKHGSFLVSPTSEGKAVNLFLLSKITYGDSSDGLTVLGLAGGIAGPNLNNDSASGVAVATFGLMDQFNTGCTSTSCSGATLDNDFVTLATTVAHEVGHFLGLNHPQESGTTADNSSFVPDVDAIADTPTCSLGTVTGKTGYYTTHNSCLTGAALGTYAASGCDAACPGYNGSTTFCASATQCQFNHIMWWTTQNRSQSTGSGDGTIFSTNSGVILNASPMVY